MKSTFQNSVFEGGSVDWHIFPVLLVNFLSNFLQKWPHENFMCVIKIWKKYVTRPTQIYIHLVYYSTCLLVYGRSEELVDEHQVQEISAYSTNDLNIKSNLWILIIFKNQFIAKNFEHLFHNNFGFRTGNIWKRMLKKVYTSTELAI